MSDEGSKGEDSAGNGGESIVVGAEESTTTAPSAKANEDCDFGEREDGKEEEAKTTVTTPAPAPAKSTDTSSTPAPAPAKKTRMPAKFRTRKPSDMPRRPLTSYNIFFRDERAKIISERDTPNDPFAAAASNSKGNLFETLGKMIASRWKEVTPEVKAYYK